jgi:hypothetical protein
LEDKKGAETNASSSKIGQKRRAIITRQTYHGGPLHANAASAIPLTYT